MSVIALKKSVATPPPAPAAPGPNVVVAPAMGAGSGRLARTVAAATRGALPPILGFLLFVLAWAQVAKSSGIPGPLATWEAAVKLFSDPFYVRGPNDQGIGWNVLRSLSRVGMGFGLAALVGIPVGFLIGRFVFLNRMIAPLISLLRPVSPLAWLPIGLYVFKEAQPAAVWTIFISSIWPMIINTSVGVTRVPQDYLNVAKVLNLSEWKVFTKILSRRCCPTRSRACGCRSAWRGS